MIALRRMLGAAMLLILALALAGCSAEPVSFADLPLHPAATTLAAGINPLADSVSESFREAMGGENVELEMQLYSLPPEMGWEEIKSFYEQQIGGDWEAAAALGQETEMFKTIGWTRGSFASEQGLAVGYGPPMLGNAPFLIVALFSE